MVRETGITERVSSGHSLRAGFVTSALDAGLDSLKAMKKSWHKKIDTLAIYDRRANGFDDHTGDEFLMSFGCSKAFFRETSVRRVRCHGVAAASSCFCLGLRSW